MQSRPSETFPAQVVSAKGKEAPFPLSVVGPSDESPRLYALTHHYVDALAIHGCNSFPDQEANAGSRTSLVSELLWLIITGSF